MADKGGWVYVLTNEAMPGLVKVGQTYKTPEIRAQELSSETGVAAHYVVVYKAFVPNYDQVEKVVHRKLKSAGKHYNKEFFKCEAFEVIRHIRDSTTIKFEESKEDIDRKIRQQKSLEEKQKSLEEKQKAERQRLAKKKEQQEAEQRLAAEAETHEKKLAEKSGNWKGASQTGCGTLILNILVALILLVSVPWVVFALFGVVAVAFNSIIEIINKTF
jgi:Fe2+ transport system protein B